MGIIGSAVGGALQIGSAIFGAAAGSKAMKNVKRNLQNQMQENQNWYDRRYNEDSTQRADAQRILTIMNDTIKQRNQQEAGTAAVMGGSQEALAASKAANAQSMADATSQIAMAGDRRKDQIENQYMQTKSDLNGQLNNLEQAKAENIKQAAQAVGEVGSKMGSMF